MKIKYVDIISLYILFFYFFCSFFQISSKIVINNIIQLGGENFRYIHFSINSKGDIIIDTTANPGNNERRFYGLKRNGRPYFFDEKNVETPYRSLFANNLENENQQKVDGASNFILLSKQNNSEIKEYLLSFSKLDNYMELYDFDKNEIISKKTINIFNDNIISNINTFIKAKSTYDDNYSYYISYIHDNDSGDYKFYVLRCYFTSKNITSTGYHLDTGCRKSTINKEISSCFETEEEKIVCFYQKTDLKYQIVTIDREFIDTQKYTTLTVASDDSDLFFKAIHFKEEKGIFAYYSSINDKYPIVSFKELDNDDAFHNYKDFGNIAINLMTFNSKAGLNDI